MNKRDMVWFAVALTVFGFMTRVIYSMVDWEITHMKWDKLN